MKLQKRFPRIITFSDSMAHSDPLFIRLAILKVQDLHKLQLGNLVFAWRQHSTPAQFKFYFIQAISVHGYNTRFASGGNLTLSNVNTTRYGIRSLKLCNSVPGDCRDSLASHFVQK